MLCYKYDSKQHKTTVNDTNATANDVIKKNPAKFSINKLWHKYISKQHKTTVNDTNATANDVM